MFLASSLHLRNITVACGRECSNALPDSRRVAGLAEPVAVDIIADDARVAGSFTEVALSRDHGQKGCDDTGEQNGLHSGWAMLVARVPYGN